MVLMQSIFIYIIFPLHSLGSDLFIFVVPSSSSLVIPRETEGYGVELVCPSVRFRKDVVGKSL